MLKLYGSPQTCSSASLFVLQYSGADYDYEEVKLHDEGNKENEFLSRMKHWDYKVPVVEFSDGRRLTENVAILLYLGSIAPDLGLLGTTEEQKMRVPEWLAFINYEIHHIVMHLFATRRYTANHGEDHLEAVKEAAKRRLAVVYAEAGERLGDKPYLTGDTVTVADPYFYMTIRWICMILGMKDIVPRNVVDFAVRMEQLPAMQFVLQKGQLKPIERALTAVR